MSNMGGACSRQRSSWQEPSRHQSRETRKERGSSRSPESPATRRSLRHSVVAAIPDGSIVNLYPSSDNYVTEDNGLRSPKNLSALCTDALCRSLPYLDGELPAGLPQDIVDDIVTSLVRHSALTATTLKVLKNCELGSLSLAGCRGVTDEWLKPLSSPVIASSPQLSHLSTQDFNGIEHMDLDDCDGRKPPDLFYNASLQIDASSSTSYHEVVEESSCSTSSFHSASSTPFGQSSSTDHSMLQHHHESKDVPVPMEGCVVHQEEYPAEIASRGRVSPQEQFPVTSVTGSMVLLDLRGSQRLTDKGLIQLSDLGGLEVARLDNCHSIVGRGLLAFSTSHRLHTLSLANCRRLTDEAIINISHLTSLTALSVDGCRCLTDRSLAAISGLYRLQKLDLSQCDLLTDNGLDHLENLHGIEELSLGWCRAITDRGLELFTRHNRSVLRILRLARCPITDEGVEYIGRLTSLEELDLNGCSNIGSSSLGKTLARLPNLTSLDVSYLPGTLRTSWQGKIKSLKSLELCYSGVRDSHLSKLVDLPSLEELNLDSCPVGDWAIAHLADNNVVPNLKSLDLADTDLTDLGMVHLAKFKKLNRLSLFYCNITKVGLRHLSQLSSLEVLNLDSREIGDDGLFHLRNLTKLRSLDIFSGRITDSGCGHLAKIKSLESLELCGGGIGDLGCTLLATLENLTSLNLSQNERITNRGAAVLAALVNLKSLNLSNTRVTSNALTYFSGLVKLKSLALYGCRGIEEGHSLDTFQNGLPSLKCLRLNTGSDQDGMVLPNENDDDDTTDDLVIGQHGYDDSDGSQDNSGSEDDDSIVMEDVEVESTANSHSSSSYYSDHD